MSVDAAYAAELREWLRNVQTSLQKTMDEVTRKLEETKLLDVVEDGLASPDRPAEVVIAIETPIASSLLPGQPEPDKKPETTVAFQDAGTEADKQNPEKVPVLIKPRSIVACGNSAAPAADDSPNVVLAVRQESWLKGWFRRCMCPCRAKCLQKRQPRPLVPAKPTPFFTYTKQQNDTEPLGKKLKNMRKCKAIPTRLWEPRVCITDAKGEKQSLKAVEDAQDKNQHMAFPVDIQWVWLTPDELPKTTWKDTVWWKKTGLLDNMSLRSLSMRLHARMHVLDQEVILLTQGMIRDTEQALSTKTTLQHQTDECEMEMALDAITDIDDLLTLDFRCGDQMLTIGKILQAAGCPWDAFLEAYMQGRNSALKCTTEGRRRELILAAAKGADGLEQLFLQLVSRIDQNELLLFKLVLLTFNGLTCAAQFAWSDFLVPALETVTTTAIPTWQQQIAKLANP